MKLSNKQVAASKTMSYALRHRPEEFGLVLDKEGWVDIKTFCAALAGHKDGVSLTEEDIAQIIAGSEKKRFEMSNGKIRATYGHSVESRIEFTPSVPPPVLYHGTSNRALDSIRKDGLLPMNRQYVHLSSDVATARKVGERHGKNPVILTVDAAKMHADGMKFFHSANDGTWMCENVPFRYIVKTVFHY